MTQQLQAGGKKRRRGAGGAGRTRTKHNGERRTEDETPWETKGGDITGCGSSLCLGAWVGCLTVDPEGAKTLEIMFAFSV